MAKERRTGGERERRARGFVFVRVEKNPEKTGGGEEDERKPMRWSGVDEKKPDGMPGRWKTEQVYSF
jgi:hypothetical protein